MSAVVPYKRTRPRVSEIKIGLPIRGRLFREMGLLLHWLRAHGTQIIPAHAPNVQIGTSGSWTLRYYVKPGGLAIARVWVLLLREDGSGSSAPRLEVTYPDSTAVVYPAVRLTSGGTYTTLYVEELSSKSATAGEVALALAHDSGTGTVFVDSVACFELPRAVLTQDATDLGVDLETLRPGASIFDSQNQSAGAVANALASTWPRRQVLAWSGPTLDVSSTSYTDLFAVPIPVLPKRVLVADTTYDLTWTVYAAMSDVGAAGTVRVTSGLDSNTATLTFSSTSFAWGTPATIEVQCEDLAETDGLPTGGWETLQFAAKRDSGTGSIYVRAVAAYEAT